MFNETAIVGSQVLKGYILYKKEHNIINTLLMARLHIHELISTKGNTTYAFGFNSEICIGM